MPARRICEHKAKLVPGFARQYGVDKPVYVEEYNSILEARARECSVKRWRRARKIALIGTIDPEWRNLFAAYTYESLQFDPAIHAFIAHSLRRWTALYEKKFEFVLSRYKPTRPVSARDLADMIVALIEGGFILTRSYNDPALVARQSRQFRQYLELLFAHDT